MLCFESQLSRGILSYCKGYCGRADAVLAGDLKVFRLLCNTNLNMNIPSRGSKDTRLSSDVHHCSLHAIHCLKKRCKKWYPNVLIWQLPFPLLCTPNTKTCQRGCVFVFSASPTHSDARQDLNPHPCWCVFALSVLQIPPMDDKHETTPILVCFCVWHLSYTLPMHYKGVYPPSYIFSVQ